MFLAFNKSKLQQKGTIVIEKDYSLTRKEIEAYIRSIEKELALLPEGRANFIHRPNRTQIIHYLPDKSKHYISRATSENVELADKLAEKDYLEKALRQLQEICKSKNAAEKYADTCRALFQLYDRLPVERKLRVSPIKTPEEMKLEKWVNEPFQHKPFNDNVPLLLSDNGTRVRSKSEKLILNRLEHLGVPYKYEKPLYLKTAGTIHPDFTLWDVKKRREMYWEHFGLIDEADYRNNMLSRINAYRSSGYAGQLIMTFETASRPLDTREIDCIVEAFNLR